MNNLIKEIVENGVEVSIVKYNNVIMYDIQTGAKSQLLLEEKEDNNFLAYMRYQEIEKLNNPSLEDIAWLVKHCMHGRNYVNTSWLDIMKKLGVIKEIVDKENND